jgi:hypothetical protein
MHIMPKYEVKANGCIGCFILLAAHCIMASVAYLAFTLFCK